MKVAAIQLARVLAFLETTDLNPRGHVFFPALVPMLVKHFGFLKFPQTFADLDNAKGIEFSEGQFEGVSIDKIVILSNGIQVDTRTSTETSKTLLIDMLTWLKQEAHIAFEPAMLKHWGFLSQMTFYSDADYDSLNPAVMRLCASVSEAVSTLQHDRYDFGFNGIAISFDRFNRTAPIANFLFQRRVDTPFTENKYYSEAPLPTDLHLRFLEEFEADVNRPNTVEAVPIPDEGPRKKSRPIIFGDE